MKVMFDYKVGDTIYDNGEYGPFTIIEDLGVRPDDKGKTNRYARIRFNNPNKYGFNTEIDVRYGNINSGGHVRDPYYPSTCGIGCLGIIDYRLKRDPLYRRLRDTWNAIIRACYRPDSAKYKYFGAKGITVSERWQCLANFLEDVKLLENYDVYAADVRERAVTGAPAKYVFDFNNSYSEYSPASCRFTSVYENKSKSDYNMQLNSTSYKGIRQTSSYRFEALFRNKRIGIFDNINSAIMRRNLYIKANTNNPDYILPLPPEYNGGNWDMWDTRQGEIKPYRYLGKLNMYNVTNYDIDPDERLKQLLIRSGVDPSEI